MKVKAKMNSLASTTIGIEEVLSIQIVSLLLQNILMRERGTLVWESEINNTRIVELGNPYQGLKRCYHLHLISRTKFQLLQIPIRD